MYKNIIKKTKAITKLIFTITVIFCILSMVLMFWFVNNNENKFINSYGNQQQLLVDTAANEIKSLIDSKGTDNKADIIAVKNVLNKMYTSGNRYWIAAKDKVVIFKESDQITKDYEGSSINNVINVHDIVSVRTFESQDHIYTIVMSTDTSYALTTGGVNSHNIYLFLYVIGILITYFVFITYLALRIENLKVNNSENLEKLKEKNRVIESLGTAALHHEYEGAVLYERSSDEEKIIPDVVTSYRFKFYINASHSIYINGSLGQKHPHTWEITMVVSQNVELFIRFKRIEETLENFFARYQDVYLNEVEPFNKVNPTLENICRYFNAELIAMTRKVGWKLERIEISETPTRSYVIDNCD